jgi:chemotaxis receptor (MCP) glutamine deamidase CheD
MTPPASAVLIHLLLPEPVSAGSQDRPEKYATTGIPVFLKQLLDMGATRENMKAVVAGGALVGPLTSQDMSLDIGGRTTENAYIALHNAGIAIERAETGGFFTCCIQLDMQRWECSIQPAGFDAVAAKAVAPRRQSRISRKPSKISSPSPR